MVAISVVTNEDGVVTSVSVVSVTAVVLKKPVVGKNVSVSFSETVVDNSESVLTVSGKLSVEN